MTTQTTGYRVCYERCEDGYDYHVVDADSDKYNYCYGSYQTSAEAVSRAAEMNRNEQVDRLSDLISEKISDLQNESDLVTLRRVANLLGLK